MSGRVFLVMNDEDYYQRTVEAVYSTRTAAEEHIAAVAALKPPFPGSERLGPAELAERSIDEEEVRDVFLEQSHSHGDPNPFDPDCALCQAQKNGGQQ